METPKKQVNDQPYSVRLVFGLLTLVLVVLILYTLQSVLIPVLFSILIAISLFPLTRFFERMRLGKAFSALLAVIIALAVMVAIGWFIVYESILIGKDATSITEKMLNVFESGMNWTQDLFGWNRTEIMEKLRVQSSKAMENIGGILSSTFGSLGNILAGVVLVPLFSFFLLYYHVFFKEFFFKAFGTESRAKVNEVLNKIYNVVQSYLIGLVTVMGIVAVLNTIGLLALGIEYAWFFGTLASLLMLLPYIGIAIGSILPALFALATKDTAWYALGVVAWFQVVQFLEGNIITPNIVGSKVSINPLMAIIGILLGGMLFGLAGLILALPMLASLKVIFDANERMEALGYLIGEPEKELLKRNATQELMIKWGLVRERKKDEAKIKNLKPPKKEVENKDA